jgi:hypothetical protein
MCKERSGDLALNAEHTMRTAISHGRLRVRTTGGDPLVKAVLNSR